MDAWRNATALNYTKPTLWFVAMNATTEQWRFSGFNYSNFVILRDYLNDSTAHLYPNTTTVIEGAGAFNIGTKSIHDFVYLTLSLLIILAMAFPFYKWIDAFRDPSILANAPHWHGLRERDFWRMVNKFYVIPQSKEEAIDETDTGPGNEVTERHIRRVASLLRLLHTLDVEIWTAGDAIDADPQTIMNMRRQANAVSEEIQRTVGSWTYNHSWTLEEAENIRRISALVARPPEAM